jgi:low temperature requirement protein LtrA
VTSRTAKLLRRQEEPRAAFLELFFDLVYVFALAQLSQTLLERLSWSHAFQTLVLLLALWWVWIRTVAVTDMFDPRRPEIQLLVLAIMFGTLVMAAAGPEAYGERGLYFAGTYVAIQLGGHAAAALMLRGHEALRYILRLLFWFGMSTPPWIAGAFASGWGRVALWTLAVSVDYAGPALRWLTPRLGRVRLAELPLSGAHLAERYQQFFIVALGELVLVTGLTLARSGFQADRIAAVVIAFATEALMWRLYIHRAGGVLPEAIAASPDPIRVVRSANYSHLVMVAGIVTTAVGKEYIISHPFEDTQPAWIAVILSGPVLFMAGRSMFEHTVFDRVARRRLIAILVLAAISPAMILVPPLVVGLAPTLVLAAVALSDAISSSGRPPEPPSPPR